MNFWPFSRSLKSSVGHLLFGQRFSHPSENMQAYAKEGYGLNPVVYACIELTSKAFSRVPLYVYDKDDQILYDHPLAKLLERPNLAQGGVEFRAALCAWLMITGNAWQQKLFSGGRPSELVAWEPYQMSVERQQGNPLPRRYTFGKNTEHQRNFDIDLITGKCEMMHWKLFNPKQGCGDLGQSPLAAAAYSVDSSNASREWNFQSLKNSGSFSLLVTTEKDVTRKQEQSYEEQMKENWTGPKNANKIKFMGSASKVQNVSMTPKDMEWSTGMKLNSQDICMALGVPSQLIGLEGSQTYANYEQANIAHCTQTVMPLLDLYCSELNRWLTPDFGEGLRIGYSEDDIPALEPLRREKRKELLTSKLLTINEGRRVLGYEDYDPNQEGEANKIFVQPNDIPLDESFDDSSDDEENISNDATVLEDGEEEDI